MFVKRYTKEDGAQVEEWYESWYETAGTQLYVGLVYAFVGTLAVVSTPVVAVYRMFRPARIGSGERRTELFRLEENRKMA